MEEKGEGEEEEGGMRAAWRSYSGAEPESGKFVSR